MSAIVTEQLRIKNAKDFLKSTQLNELYVVIGRTKPWDDDSVEQTPGQSASETVYELWDGLYAGKRVKVDDIHHTIPKHLWEADTADFVAYDPSDPYLSQKKFHTTVVDDYSIRVYKLIVRGAGNSTVKPDFITSAIAGGADGYRWKYMYSIPIGLYNSFLNEFYVPVLTTPSNVATNSSTLGVQPAPPTGHGADNISELFAYSVGIISKFIYNESGRIPANNQFRTVALLENPRVFNGVIGSAVDTGQPHSGDVFSGDVATLATTINIVATADTVVPNDELKTSTGTCVVVGYDAELGKAYVLPKLGQIASGQNITSLTTGLAASITSITGPSASKYSGNTLYTEYRKPVYRAGNQTEVISIILEF